MDALADNLQVNRKVVTDQTGTSIKCRSRGLQALATTETLVLTRFVWPIKSARSRVASSRDRMTSPRNSGPY